MPATKSPYAAGTANAAGNEAETTPGTKKLSPMVRRNMWGATKGSSASRRSIVRRRGQTKRFAATPEATRLIRALSPNRARISIEILLTRRLISPATILRKTLTAGHRLRRDAEPTKRNREIPRLRDATCASRTKQQRRRVPALGMTAKKRESGVEPPHSRKQQIARSANASGA